MRRLMIAGAAVAATAATLPVIRKAWVAGGASSASIRQRVIRSENWARGSFHNLDSFRNFTPTSSDDIAQMVLKRTAGHPRGIVPVVVSEVQDTSDALAVSWLGHATTLIELDGFRLLTDPVWGSRASPSPLVGPARLHSPPLPLNKLGHLDAIIISHDHYDHLDYPTIIQLARSQSAPFYVPLGVGAHLVVWGVPPERIVECDWYESAHCGDLQFTLTPARHFSGRMLHRNNTLWGSWAIRGPRHSVFFTGDTGYTSRYRNIGEKLGPFDVALVPIGAYSSLWPDAHTTPEEALDIADFVRARLTLPIHWGTFNLSQHRYSEPADRFVAASRCPIVVPVPGERIRVGDSLPEYETQRWWDGL